jgi:sugar phosphate isomerase/epimerase
MVVGFSTGSIALHDFRLGIQLVSEVPVLAIELSALREQELEPLIEALDTLDLARFEYVSLHAPSRLAKLTEQNVVDCLASVVEKNWPVVVHPDVIKDFDCWQTLGNCLCIENMDNRKPVGRTFAELEQFFDALPDAKFCFDIGHARQVDPTMCEADTMLREYANRLAQVHLSLVNSKSHHERLDFSSIQSFRKVWELIPNDVPIILETPVNSLPEIQHEYEKARELVLN